MTTQNPTRPAVLPLLPDVTQTLPADEACACGAYGDFCCDHCQRPCCGEHVTSFALEVIGPQEFPAVFLCDAYPEPRLYSADETQEWGNCADEERGVRAAAQPFEDEGTDDVLECWR